MAKIKSFDELSFSDDFVFGKVMLDEALCRDILECLLQQKIGELQHVQQQKEISYSLDGKPVRLDIYTRTQNSIYDAEMQNLNHHNINSLELPKRSRVYQALIDSDNIKRNNDYDMLPDSVVIFICTFDPFGYGEYKYTFSEVSGGSFRFELNSGTIKHFFNCSYSGDSIPSDIKNLYEYIRNGNVSDELTERIDEAVFNIKRNEKWRSDYMKELFIYNDYKRLGREEGREEGRREQQAITEQEKIRADKAEALNRELSQRIKELEEQLSKNIK